MRKLLRPQALSRVLLSPRPGLRAAAAAAQKEFNEESFLECIMDFMRGVRQRRAARRRSRTPTRRHHLPRCPGGATGVEASTSHTHHG